MPRGIYPRTKYHREKIKKGHLGLRHSEETKKKISKAKKGKPNGLLGKHWKIKDTSKMKGHIISETTRRKLSEQKKGENNPRWKGGISYEPYSVDWTKDLKRAIRKRDKYTCCLCGKEPAICCHHIDYNKKNCNPDNLITLCHSCNTKVNSNRKHWTKFFKKLLKEKFK